jgi:hypothetical protein
MLMSTGAGGWLAAALGVNVTPSARTDGKHSTHAYVVLHVRNIEQEIANRRVNDPHHCSNGLIRGYKTARRGGRPQEVIVAGYRV